MLAKREHSGAELSRKLRQKGFSPAEVNNALAQLERDGYLSDERYALARARYRVTQSKWGWQRVVMELKTAGVEAAVIDMAQQALLDDGVSLSDGATELAARKMGGGRASADPEERFKQRQKAIAALVRKGYSFADAKRAVEMAADNLSEGG